MLRFGGSGADPQFRERSRADFRRGSVTLAPKSAASLHGQAGFSEPAVTPPNDPDTNPYARLSPWPRMRQGPMRLALPPRPQPPTRLRAPESWPTPERLASSVLTGSALPIAAPGAAAPGRPPPAGQPELRLIRTPPVAAPAPSPAPAPEPPVVVAPRARPPEAPLFVAPRGPRRAKPATPRPRRNSNLAVTAAAGCGLAFASGALIVLLTHRPAPPPPKTPAAQLPLEVAEPAAEPADAPRPARARRPATRSQAPKRLIKISAEPQSATPEEPPPVLIAPAPAPNEPPPRPPLDPSAPIETHTPG